MRQFDLPGWRQVFEEALIRVTKPSEIGRSNRSNRFRYPREQYLHDPFGSLDDGTMTLATAEPGRIWAAACVNNLGSVIL
jgi:hypothetical protein